MQQPCGLIDVLFVLGIRNRNRAKTQAEIYYLHNDHLGNPQAVTDENRNVVWQGEYSPFGELVNETGTLEQPHRFPGQHADPETGLYYNYFRDYDPSLGRYVQSDPIGLRGGVNTYGYVGGNPVNFVDPYGLWPFGMPEKDRALEQAPSVLQNYVPSLTKEEADNLSKDAIDELGWGDVKDVMPYRDAPVPSRLCDLSAEQKNLLLDFLSDLPERNSGAVNKVKDACECSK